MTPQFLLLALILLLAAFAGGYILATRRYAPFGLVTRVRNLDPKPAANEYYWSVMIRQPDETTNTWLLTEDDIARILARGLKNPEDINPGLRVVEEDPKDIA